MLAKICVLILSLGVTAGILLHLRQARLQAVHELTKTQLRMLERDRDLFRIRTQIALRITPQRVEQIAQQFGPLKPMGVDKAVVEPDPEPSPVDSGEHAKTAKPKPSTASPPRREGEAFDDFETPAQARLQAHALAHPRHDADPDRTGR